jgi:hypothetical protein
MQNGRLIILSLAALILAGCQHASPAGSEVVHEKDPRRCAEIAGGTSLHEHLLKTRRDGSCDVRRWSS